MNSKRMIATLVAMLVCIVATAQKTWTGTTSTAWNTSTNWSPAGAPAATDNVTIPSAPANQPVISGTTGVCANLTINAGASLSVSATSSNNAQLTASGSTVISGTLTLGGTITRTGKLIVNNITWASGSSMSGFLNSSIEVSGNWEFASGSSAAMGLSSVVFTGSTSTLITSNSASSSFGVTTFGKNSGNSVTINSASTASLRFGSTINISSGNYLMCQANITVIMAGNLVNAGNFSFSNGTVSLERTSGTQSIAVNTGDVFNNLNINTGGTATINNSLTVMKDFTIQAGTFDPQNNNLIVFGNWTNSVGPSGFTEGTGRVVFSGGNYHQYCSNETFYTLEVHKAAGGAFRLNGTTVTCSRYDWTAGAVDVLNGGTFTANDLMDDAIAGSFYLNPSCTINLTNYGGNIDLRGSLYIYGGNFNVYGGINPSWWPYQGNASITMSGGTLNFADQGIIIRTDATYSFTDNITGGTIRTAGNLGCSRSDFIPAAGTFEMYGSTNATLSVTAGNLFNLNIGKDPGTTVEIMGTTTINGILNINGGTVTAANRIINTSNNINLNAGSTLNLTGGSQLNVTGGRAFTIATGGTLSVTGTAGSNSRISRNGAGGLYELHINGSISARYATFEGMHAVNIWSQATVDPLNSFDYCTFQNGGDRFMQIANSQDIVIRGAAFPTAPLFNNVWKSNNAGSVNFKSATGTYAGQAWENDPYNRISWTTATPGLWVGQVSDLWLVAANWDNNAIPGSATDVLIPENAFTMPVIPTGTAFCHDLILEEGTSLSMSDNSSLNVYRDMDAYEGQFIMNGSSFLYFSGSEDSFWQTDMSDVYTNIRVIKDNIGIKAESYGQFQCSGTFEIREGTFLIRQTLTVTNNSATAFEIENGGRLEFDSPISSVESYGDILCHEESVIFGNGFLRCQGNFIYNAISFTDWHWRRLFLNGSGDQYIDIANPDFEFDHFTIDKPNGICYLKSGDLKTGSLVIDSGTLCCDNGPSPTATYNVYCSSWFENFVGPSGFDASSSTVVFSGWGIESPNGTEFNILDVNTYYTVLHLYGELSCAEYKWTSGGVEVTEGSVFTAADFPDFAIRGKFICNAGGTLNLNEGFYNTGIDLEGELYNYGGTINIEGFQTIWPTSDYAKLVMTAGVIDVNTNSLYIYDWPGSEFIDSISGGTIRVAGHLSIGRPDFDPEGGVIELYGDQYCSLSMTNGSRIYDLHINKTAPTDLSSDIHISNNLILDSFLDCSSHTITIEGDWKNMGGPNLFNEIAGRVRFTGIKPQYCSTEEFRTLEIDKPVQLLYNMPGADIQCGIYDWTSGGIWISGDGSFTATDLADNGIFGKYTLYGGSITLHQDAAHSTDMAGSININDGLFTISGGQSAGYWGGPGDAQLIMTGGVLDITDFGINLSDSYPYNFSSTITGGTIRTPGFFLVNTPGFNPVGGEVEIYGAGNATVSTSEGGSLWNLRTNKPSVMDRVVLLDAKINNNFIVDEGLAEVNYEAELEVGNQLDIQDGGWFDLNSGFLEMENLASINVLDGGRFISFGYPGALSHIRSRNPGNSYTLTAHSGSLVEASYTIFEHLPAQGIYVGQGAVVNPSYAFNNCEFRSGSPGGTLLTIENDQDVVIENAFFPPNSWNGGSNVRKTLNQGSITFMNATGDFSGENFDDDPHDLIQWGPLKQLNLQVVLEGLYAGSGIMNQAFNESGPQFEAGIADEITVEFHSGLDYYETEYVAQHVKLGTMGAAIIRFPASLSQSYYITIRHRNGIETTTATPVSFAPETINYSFNTPAKAYGGNLQLMADGHYVIYSGDVNQDGFIDTADMTPVDNDATNYEAGYRTTDVNGDGVIDTADMTIVDNNAAQYIGAATP